MTTIGSRLTWGKASGLWMQLGAALGIAMIVLAVVLIRAEASAVSGRFLSIGDVGPHAGVLPSGMRGTCVAPAFTTYTLTLAPTDGPEETLRVPITPLAVVSTDPCTLQGTFNVRVDPSVNYLACVESLNDTPGAFDQSGLGWCGIAVPTGILQDGKLDIVLPGGRAT